MKSIMEEASSILKAIEKCWTRAGKPQEFSVKILEEPEKYFFGLTKKPAKVALLYKDSEQDDYRNKSRRPQQHKPYRRPYNRRPRSGESRQGDRRDQQGHSEERRNKYQSRPHRADSRRPEHGQRSQDRPGYSNKNNGSDSQR